jgi:perosamine synthetase
LTENNYIRIVKSFMKKTKWTPKTMILTAGPDTSGNEEKYVYDATLHGWNEHAFDYIEKFEHAFATYTGSKYAMTLAGGTCALQLALTAVGIKKSDEIILPDMTYFACSDVIKILGATPVFVDILPDTWCIDPEKVKRAITPKTRAIMPVDIYGNPHDMKAIRDIADQYNIFVIEDACPAVGAYVGKKHVGSYADFTAYSFQGAKILTTGTGGMLTTNNESLYKRARHLSDHGEAKGWEKGYVRKFWQMEVGWEFDMSNLQCAFGLAQLERLEEFIAKKRQIYTWYYERLSDLKGISLNKERVNTRSIRWMSSIILDRDFGISRDELRKKLKEKLIDTRPFFYPISMFPMYDEADTPVSHHIGLNGINLPSAHRMTEETVDYVAGQVRSILQHT